MKIASSEADKFVKQPSERFLRVGWRRERILDGPSTGVRLASSVWHYKTTDEKSAQSLSNLSGPEIETCSGPVVALAAPADAWRRRASAEAAGGPNHPETRRPSGTLVSRMAAVRDRERTL